MPGELGPSLDEEDIRGVVGTQARIYVLPTGPLSFALADRLPDHKGPYNGSIRIWLRISAQDEQPPSVTVYDAKAVYGQQSLRALAFQLREAFATHDSKPEVDPVLAYRSLEMTRVIDEAEVVKRGYEEQLTTARKEGDEQVKQARKERDEAGHREREAQRRLRMAERDSGASVGSEDAEGALRLLILQRWLDLSYDERADHPLGRYVLGPDFVRSAQPLTYLVRDRLAFVCAAIVSDRVGQLASLALRSVAPKDEDNQDVSRWQCNLTRIDSQSPPTVRYEKRASDNTIVFTGIGAYHEDPVDARR
jgi:hypothetical protein